ncbi:MAG: hypothetical protein JXQ83_11695 [Candidatus Glassbacteria bacterium]|nr:hypothetical protein [Candidatus Glassbacteria bacterium]
MPGLYSQWLAYVMQQEIAARAGRLRKRRKSRAGRFISTTLKKQLEKAYQTPLRKVLENLDDSLVRLEEIYLAPAQQFSGIAAEPASEEDEDSDTLIIDTSRKNRVLKEELKEVIETLKEVLSYRFRKRYLNTLPQLQRTILDLSLYACYLYKQIEVYQYSKHYNRELLFQFVDNGINSLIKKYHRSIERIYPEAQETAADNSMEQALEE